MESNSPNNLRSKLDSQLREEFGRINYSYTAHNKQARFYANWERWLKSLSLLSSALTSGSLLIDLLGSGRNGEVISSTLAILSTITATLLSTFDFPSKEKTHQEAANALWKIKNEYLSLLVDFKELEEKEIRVKRDELLKKSSEVYEAYPTTGSRAYHQAQQALKFDEEQYFEEWEIDLMLPEALRRTDPQIIREKQEAAKSKKQFHFLS